MGTRAAGTPRSRAPRQKKQPASVAGRVKSRLSRDLLGAAGGAGRRFRPARRDTRQDFVDQPPRLRQHVLVAAGRRAEDEFRDPGGDVGGDALDDRFGVTDRKMARGVAPGALAVGFVEPVETGVVRAAEAERDAGAIMVLVDRTARARGSSADRGDNRGELVRSFGARLPAGAEARGAPDRSF